MALGKYSPQNGATEVHSYVADHNREMPFREVLVKYDNITDIFTYMRCHAVLLGDRILQQCHAAELDA
jgi:hypothetical protein